MVLLSAAMCQAGIGRKTKPFSYFERLEGRQEAGALGVSTQVTAFSSPVHMEALKATDAQCGIAKEGSDTIDKRGNEHSCATIQPGQCFL